MSKARSAARKQTEIQIAHKLIRIKRQNLSVADKIADAFKLSKVASRILAARGYEPDDRLKHFMLPTLREGLPDPAGLKNISQACNLIIEMIKNKKSIAICCDFDVDGLSGGAQAYHFLKSLGVETQVFVPDRFVDGYGLNEKTIRTIAEKKFSLLIAIDFGTTNIKELTIARELGIKTLVIDHHHVGDTVSPADVFINPNQKGCDFADRVLCASGLTWYLLVGLAKRLGDSCKVQAKNYLDLACLGTICDMVPLIGANRIIAKRGLELLTKTTRPGLQALKDVIGIRRAVTCTDVSFGIGPRLNAAGRMVHGEVVIDLLTTSDTELAGKLARQLNKLNLERQDIENQVKEKAILQVKGRASLPFGIAVWDPDYHTGVIGIVAQRLVEAFYRPTAVMGVDTKGIFKGSVRGIKGFSVVEALGAVKDHLLKFGGHDGAGGFSVEEKMLEKFAAAFENECERRLKELEINPFAEADTEVSLKDISFDLIDELKDFAPFGMGNPSPQVLIKNLTVVEIKELKGTHLKTTLTDGKMYIAGLMWRQTSHPALVKGTNVNIVGKPECSTFNGTRELQVNLQAIESA